ncbi:DUF2062 domain-containing protein [Mongoliimonas terrestris]|uniref:DUF2062 domain-containing protein n=1 Tax=Mongoliimonas terrestris TaxID=1709001 RepID=UPI000B21A464|nr:DUF2062 domain-containing protein [Mongoliimonas terrestris]
MFARRHRRDWRQSVRHALWPKRGWRRTSAYVWKRIIRLTATPYAIAAGVAAGAFASFTPFIGLHFLLAFLVAYLVRANMLAAALGTAVGNPLTFPLIWAATHEVGKWVLSGGANPIASPVEVAASNGTAVLTEGLFQAGFHRLWPVLKPMLVGSVPLGLIAGFICFVVVYPAVSGFQNRRRERIRRGRAALQTAPQSESVAP